MGSGSRFRFPFVDLSILLAMLLISWTVYCLSRIEPRLAADLRQSAELPALFKECKDLFRASLDDPELARRELDLVWYDALQLKAEYTGIADRLESGLPDLESALAEASAARSRGELPRQALELKTWIAKQKERAGLERLEARSREWQRQVELAHVKDSNGPVTVGIDLGTLLQDTDRAFDSYLSNLREITNNAGKLLVAAYVAQRVDQARKAFEQLSEFARRARQASAAITAFLGSRARSDTARRNRRQEEVVRAFIESDSPAAFTARLRTRPGEAPAEPAVQISSLRRIRYGLLAALIGMGVFLIVDLYWRLVVMPLRLRLVERETAIEHQEKLTNFEQLAATLAHEIRNPLTTINARLYTVQRKLQEGSPERKDAAVIGNEIDRVTQILKDFIQLTRPSPPELTLVTSGPLLRDVHDLMAPQLQRQDIGLECRSEASVEFYGDRQQLKQVLINLVQNGAQSIGRKGHIRLRARDDRLPLHGTETRVAIIEVQDDGPGVPPEVQGRLFEPFFSTRKDGTGLGLPISARIVNRHGGILNFETEPGLGTTFRIILPAGEPHPGVREKGLPTRGAAR